MHEKLAASVANGEAYYNGHTPTIVHTGGLSGQDIALGMAGDWAVDRSTEWTLALQSPGHCLAYICSPECEVS